MFLKLAKKNTKKKKNALLAQIVLADTNHKINVLMEVYTEI